MVLELHCFVIHLSNCGCGVIHDIGVSSWLLLQDHLHIVILHLYSSAYTFIIF